MPCPSSSSGLHCSPGAMLTPHHQLQGSTEWWKTCRKVTWPSFFRRIKITWERGNRRRGSDRDVMLLSPPGSHMSQLLTVSINSMNLEKRKSQATRTICKKQGSLRTLHCSMNPQVAMSTGHTQTAPPRFLWPSSPPYPQRLRVIGVVHGVTAPGIGTQPARHQELEKGVNETSGGPFIPQTPPLFKLSG